jgi:hypothetical protein
VPAQQRLRPHQEDIPAAARQRAAQRGKQQSIVLLKARPPDVAAKDRQLVPEHENLQLLRPIASSTEHHQLQQPAYDDIQR